MIKRNASVVHAAILCLFLTAITAWPEETAYLIPPHGAAPTINDTCRFIAGMKPIGNSYLTPLCKNADWMSYAAYMDSHWGHFDQTRMQVIRKWSDAQMKGVDQRAPVFYPFSGPDFAYVYNFFPHASAYVLCGLEPVGGIPDLAAVPSLTQSLEGLKTSFETFFNAGYFVTKEMHDLKSNTLSGTVPMFCVLLARTGNTVNDIKLLRNGVQIQFVPEGERRARTLYYFTADISNSGLASNGFLDFVKSTGAKNCYVKAASYLMHSNEFSTIRNGLLTMNNAILQDDSGIPLRYFDPKWRFRLFGAYTPPLDMFKQYTQPDLAAMYAKGTAGKLDFGAGYHWNRTEANLMLATRK